MRLTKPIKRIIVFAGLALLAGAIFLAYPTSSSSQHRRGIAEKTYPGFNLILISVDTLRADELGTYGSKHQSSPSIDAFANEAIVFENCIAQAPATTASHSSIFTSLYPSRHGVWSAKYRLDDATTQLGDVLSEKGYETGAFTYGVKVARKRNFHGFDVFKHVVDRPDFTRALGYSPEQFESMLRWTRDHSKEPFFLFWHTKKTHAPYTPSAEFDVFKDKDYSGPIDVYPHFPLTTKVNKKHGAYFESMMDQLTAADFEYVRDKYRGEVLELDALFARFMSFLKEQDLLDNTIIVFTSDHGESFGDREHRQKVGHGILYREVLRVPLLIRIPGVKHARLDTLVESIDIMPTVLDLLALQKPAGIDGSNLFVKDMASATEHHWAYSETRDRLALERKDHTLLYFFESDEFELYNIRDDPHQRRNLIAQGIPEQALFTKEMLARRGGENRSAPSLVVDDHMVEQLEALGYLQ